MFCENCGAELQELNQPFCPNCGSPLRKKTQFIAETIRNKSKEILIFLEPHVNRMWIWQGSDTTTRKKFMAYKKAEAIRDKYGSGYKIERIDEGSEPSDFKKMIERYKIQSKS